LSKKGWRKNEPFDDEFPPEEPRYFNHQIKKHLTDKNSFDRFCNLVRLPVNDIEHLCSIPKGYFTEYINEATMDEANTTEDKQLSLFNL
jgi:hypothetical protein